VAGTRGQTSFDGLRADHIDGLLARWVAVDEIERILRKAADEASDPS